MKYYCECPEVWALEFLEEMDFAGYWVSSLTRSWMKGYPDNCTLPWTDYVEYVRRLSSHTNKRIIVDVDMMYAEENIACIVAKEYEDAGASGIVIESKVFPKINSLSSGVVLMTPEKFQRMIYKISKSVNSLEIYARLEYLYKMPEEPEKVADIGLKCIESGADGVIVHWKDAMNLKPLKKTLSIMKEEDPDAGYGIIPTKFLENVYAGEFSELADFSILGNSVSSIIRDRFSKITMDDIIKQSPPFKPILEKSNGYINKTSSLIVLGAKMSEDGTYALDHNVTIQDIFRFSESLDVDSTILAVAPDTFGGEEPMIYGIILSDITIVRVDSSIGELHTLKLAMEECRSDKVVVMYADTLQCHQIAISDCSALYNYDKFVGVISCNRPTLEENLNECDNSGTLLELSHKMSLNVQEVHDE